LHLHRPTGISLLFVVLGPCWSPGAEPKAATALKEKGLTRSGTTLVVEAEKPVLIKMKEAKSLLSSYAAAASKKEEADQAAGMLAQLEERRVELQQNLDQLNQQINEQAVMPTRPGASGMGPSYLPQLLSQLNQIQTPLNQIVAEQKSLRASTPADAKALNEEVEKGAEALKAALAELRPMIDEVVKRYATLGADPAVKAAIGELETATRADFKLGPSAEFKAGMKLLDRAEKKTVRSKPAARKKGKSKK
jgi:DNA repair exonuclease SbcCD ATPase subunit